MVHNCRSWFLELRSNAGRLKRPHPRQLYYRIACYFKPSGDPGKNKVTIDELQELTRDTDIFGLRLSMTRAELELALRAEGARIVSSEDKAIHASLPNGQRDRRYLHKSWSDPRDRQ
jgi:hypothetical protein